MLFGKPARNTKMISRLDGTFALNFNYKLSSNSLADDRHFNEKFPGNHGVITRMNVRKCSAVPGRIHRPIGIGDDVPLWMLNDIMMT
jgi:hypothetical protein